ncbi:MAG: pyridoxamine 5'-phosphate oxidase family protein [Chloroflexi bacterium]|nr:pyridoxamine 5'-phosphate oxidase family protein [Chloroflexota bacterium]
MDPELARAISESREVYITTYDADGKPGTVPVWFDYHDERFYVSTYPDSLKVGKLRRNPEVKLTFGSRRGPSVTGVARVVSDEALIQRIAPIHDQKYDGGPWRSVEHLAEMWSEGVERGCGALSLGDSPVVTPRAPASIPSVRR